MKPRLPIPRLSKKKLAAANGKPIYSTIASPRKAVRKSKRKPSETLRIYGPIARRKWMKTLPCSACGVVGYSEGAHVLGNGGMSRKADADTQAPLCGPRPTSDKGFAAMGATFIGCHKQFDDYRWDFDAAHPDFDPEAEASKVHGCYAKTKGWNSSTVSFKGLARSSKSNISKCQTLPLLSFPRLP